MSSSSENGNETETPGDVSSQHEENSDSRSPNPLPQSPSENLHENKLKSDEQNDLKVSKCTSPTNGCRTPEGVLTPPNDGDADDFPVNTENEYKANKSNGRLKFFKDGMLCLELSHHDEGQQTKWVQVRRKTGNPQVVQVLKEAVIPYQMTQPLISTPSNSNHAQSVSRVESSTSHSMSDDGSSMLSSASPRVRDSTCRKQALPQRCTSIDSNFYMKPASCVVSLTFRHEVYVKARLCTIRRPYSMPDFVDIFREKVVPSMSKSGLNERSGCSCLSDSDSSSVGKCKKLGVGNESLKKDESSKKAAIEVIQKRLSELVESKMKHKREKEIRLNNFMNNGFNPIPNSLRTTLVKSTASTKLNKTEMRDREKPFVFRPISSKKSKYKNSEKTILSVPGHGTIFKDFKRRENDIDAKNHNLSLTSPINFSLPPKSRAIYGGEDTTDGKSNRVSNKHSPKMRGVSHREAKSPNNDIRLGSSNSVAKSSSSSASLLKSNSTFSSGNSANADYTYRLHSLPEKMKSAMPYSPPLNSSNYATKSQADESDDEGYLQKQTVSKVISYTINSLLGTDNSNGTSTKNNKFSDVRKHKFSGSSNCFGSPALELSTKRVSPDADKSKELSRKNSQTFGTNDQDQSSFLRHLLDTSDPIPSPSSTARAATPPANKIPPTPPKKRSAINNHNNVNITPSKSGSSPNSQTLNSESKSILITKPVNSRLSSFNGPKRSIQESSNAAAAASAYHHYTSLLPATFIPSLNSGNSYFNSPESISRTMQSVPQPMPHLGYTGDTALNLSQRGGWSPYFLPPLPFSSFQDRASNECQDLSMNRRSLSPFSGNHRSSAITDSDLPLNLCKKPRPN